MSLPGLGNIVREEAPRLRYIDWPKTWHEERYQRLVTKRYAALDTCTVDCAVRYREMISEFETKHGVKISKRTQPAVRLVRGRAWQMNSDDRIVKMNY